MDHFTLRTLVGVFILLKVGMALAILVVPCLIEKPQWHALWVFHHGHTIACGTTVIVMIGVWKLWPSHSRIFMCYVHVLIWEGLLPSLFPRLSRLQFYLLLYTASDQKLVVEKPWRRGWLPPRFTYITLYLLSLASSLCCSPCAVRAWCQFTGWEAVEDGSGCCCMERRDRGTLHPECSRYCWGM